MPDPEDPSHDVRIPVVTDSERSSGTGPALELATHADPSLDTSSPVNDSPPKFQAIGTKSGLDVPTQALADDSAPVDPNLRQTTWGIFQVAYVASSVPFLSFASLDEYRRGAKVLYRFLKEMWTIDWQSCLEYYAFTLWLIVSPSFSLCFAYLVLLNLERFVTRQESGFNMARELSEVQWLALLWLFSAIFSDQVLHGMVRTRADFGGHLRSHFIPKLVKARLEWNPTEDFPCGFPASHDYGDFIPGWDFFDGFFILVRYILALGLEVAVMGYIISREGGAWASVILGILVAAPLILTLLAPGTGMGLSGRTFWTTNSRYNRLMVLFNMVFAPDYLRLLIKDGLVDSILEEYNLVTAALGIVRADTWIIWNQPSPWYWSIPLTLTIRYPMALCALILPFTIPSTSMIATMAFLQYAILTMRCSAKSLKALAARSSPLVIMQSIERFYDVLDSPPAAPRGILDYPNVDSRNGTKFTLKDVSYRYASTISPTIKNVNLDIEPGQLVLIVGENGSGKSTLLKLLSGLVNPTEGQVLVDHTPLSRYDVNTFRKATAFITQREELYPVSLRDNMLMFLSDDSRRKSITHRDLEEAARLGGSLDFIQKKLSGGFDTVLNPCSIPSWSPMVYPGQAAFDAMERAHPIPKPTEISPGEKQRLIASKAFMKIKHSDTKLIVLDEATNSLDSRAERKIFDQFIQISRESGQTLIIVAHRLAHLAHQADQILFMKDGKVEERGTHDQLMANSQGGYADLYKAELANTNMLV